MSPIQEVVLVMQRELRKNFRSVKGIVLLTLSLLGGAGVALIHAIIRRYQSEKLGELDAASIKEGFTQFATQFYSDDEVMGKYIGSSPEFLWTVGLASVICVPLLITILGFDTVSSEMRHRTIRFWSVRCRRSSIYIGRFLGLWSTVVAMMLLVHAVIWAVVIIGGAVAAGPAVSWGMRYWAMTVPIIGAWSAIVTLVGSQFKGPFVSLLVICSTILVMYICKAIGLASHSLDFMRFISPNTLDAYILSPRPAQIASGLGGCLAFMLVGVGAGSYIFTKRDV